MQKLQCQKEISTPLFWGRIWQKNGDGADMDDNVRNPNKIEAQDQVGTVIASG
jgi:hypothetical protein